MLQGPSKLPNGDVTSAVVFLHGYGSNGEDLLGLAPMLEDKLPTTAFFAPNAPQPTVMGVGWQWFSDAGGTFIDRAGIDNATKLLEEFLEKEVYTPHGLTPKQVALVGFSMGTMAALHAAPRLTGGIACVVGFSGMMMFADSLKDIEYKQTMPVLLVHGMEDDVVPYFGSQQATKDLEANGYNVQLQLLDGLAHGIDERGIRLAASFIEGNL